MRRFFTDRLFLEEQIALYRELLVRSFSREVCIIFEALLGEAEAWLNEELVDGPRGTSGAPAAIEIPPPGG